MASRFKDLSGYLRRFTLQALGTTMLMACATQSFAQGPAVNLDTIEIIGVPDQNRGFQGAPDWIYETPSSVNVLTREQIEQRAPRNASDLFRDMSGVFTSVDRQNPGMTINIRGLQEQGRVNVNIDGARQNFQQAGHNAVGFVYVDPELIGGVQVDKGPTSIIGGAGVIGGVVTLRTLETDDILLPGKTQGVRSRITIGTNEYRYTTSHAAAYKKDNYEFVIAGSKKETGDYKPGSNGVLRFTGGTNGLVTFTDQDNWSGLMKLILRPTPEHTLKFSYIALDNAFSTGSNQFIDTNKVFTQTATADYTWKPDNQLIDLNAKLWWSGTNNHQFRPTRTGMYGYFNLQYGLNTFGGSVQNTSRFDVPLFNIAWTNGIEYFTDITKTGVITNETMVGAPQWFSGPTPAGRRNLASAFSQANFKHGDWFELIVGGRYDFYSLEGSGLFDDACGPVATPCMTPFSADKSQGRFSPKVTAAVTPKKGTQFYVTYAQGFRPPQIMETLQFGKHIGGGNLQFGPNPNLMPETSETFEIGVNFKYDNVLKEGDGFRAKVAVFDTTIDNFITMGTGRFPQAGTFGNAVQTSFAHFNLLGPTTHMLGLEVEASYDAGDYYIGSSYTLMNSEYNGSYDPFFRGPPNGPVFDPAWTRDFFFIVLPPKQKIALDVGLRFFDRKLTVGARASYFEPTDPIEAAPAFAGYRAKGADLYSVYASFAFSENLIARLNIDNLFDQAYVDALGVPTYPAPGRTVTFNLQAKF